MRPLIIFIVLAMIGVSVYVGVAAIGGHSGFPLDDAWIHQTYARNWAETGQLAYVPGQPSAGSTAPLWTLLISIAYRARIDPFLWTRLLGAISLGLSAALVYRLADRLLPYHPPVAWLAGLIGVLDWHLIWAAASGMETMVFIVLALAIIDRTLADSPGWLIGLLSGLLIATRPEGLLLIGLVAIGWAARFDRHGLRRLVPMIVTMLAVVAPLAWFNVQAGGALFPNTFYAKQKEYDVLLSSLSIWLSSIGQMLIAPLVGAPIVLVPGLGAWIIAQRRTLRDRTQWIKWLPLAWIALHTLVYAARLPVHYQHGRYLIPIIPIVILYGAIGTASLIVRRSGRRIERIMRSSGMILIVSALIILIIYAPIGAQAYAADVAIVDDEMVVVAKWLNDHVPPEAIIAAHDIGAIGYYTRRPLLDLAGLISPEVIPFIRDETRLKEWVQSHRAAWFVTFPDWYPILSHDAIFTPVFTGHSSFSPEHLTVYQMRYIK